MNVNGKEESRRPWAVTWSALATAGTLGVTIVGGALMILNWLYAENNRIRGELTAVQVEAAKNQVTKAEFNDSIKALSERFERGFDRLEKRISEASRPPPQ